MFINEYGDKNNPLVLLLAPMMVSGEDLYQLMHPFFKHEKRPTPTQYCICNTLTGALSPFRTCGYGRISGNHASAYERTG